MKLLHKKTKPWWLVADIFFLSLDLHCTLWQPQENKYPALVYSCIAFKGEIDKSVVSLYLLGLQLFEVLILSAYYVKGSLAWLQCCQFVLSVVNFNWRFHQKGSKYTFNLKLILCGIVLFKNFNSILQRGHMYKITQHMLNISIW